MFRHLISKTIICSIFFGIPSACAQSASEPEAKRSIAAMYQAAGELYRDKKWHDAAIAFREVSTSASDSTAAWMARFFEAECMFENGEVERANSAIARWLADVQKARDLPIEVKGLQWRAKFRLVDGKIQSRLLPEAEALLKEIEQSAPENDDRERAAVTLAKLAQQSGRWSEVEQYCNRLIESSADVNNLATSQWLLGIAELNRGEIENAKNRWIKAITAYPKSIAAVELAIGLGSLAFNSSQFSESEQWYLTAMNHPEPSLAGDQILFGLANAEMALGKSEDAKKHFEELLDRYSDSSLWPNAGLAVVKLLLEGQQAEDAQKWINRLSEAGLTEESQQVSLAMLQFRLSLMKGETDRAIERLATDNPSLSLASQIRLHKELAEYLTAMRRFDEAKQHWNWISSQVDRSDKSNGIEVVQRLANLRQAEIAAETRDWDQVRTYLSGPATEADTAAELFGEHRILSSRLLMSEGELDAARSELVKIVADQRSTDNHRAQAQWMIGETHFLQKNYALAIESYAKVSADPRSGKWVSTALLQAGKCYEIHGQLNDALSLYRRAIEVNSDRVAVRFAKEREQEVLKKLPVAKSTQRSLRSSETMPR